MGHLDELLRLHRHARNDTWPQAPDPRVELEGLLYAELGRALTPLLARDDAATSAARLMDFADVLHEAGSPAATVWGASPAEREHPRSSKERQILRQLVEISPYFPVRDKAFTHDATKAMLAAVRLRAGYVSPEEAQIFLPNTAEAGSVADALHVLAEAVGNRDVDMVRQVTDALAWRMRATPVDSPDGAQWRTLLVVGHAAVDASEGRLKPVDGLGDRLRRPLAARPRAAAPSRTGVGAMLGRLRQRGAAQGSSSTLVLVSGTGR